MSYKKGDKIGTFTVCIDEEKTPDRYNGVVCRCSCGCKKVMTTWEINTNLGCGYCSLERDKTFKDQIKHPHYSIYRHMQDSCYKNGYKPYGSVGARGIKVCPDWNKSFSNFVLDMGCKTVYDELSRIDKKKDYSKDNCEWKIIRKY